ncbi:Protein TAR1 [Melia azedarach]|nr:Protein TAR1 [Melia azedarach]
MLMSHGARSKKLLKPYIGGQCSSPLGCLSGMAMGRPPWGPPSLAGAPAHTCWPVLRHVVGTTVGCIFFFFFTSSGAGAAWPDVSSAPDGTRLGVVAPCSCIELSTLHPLQLFPKRLSGLAGAFGILCCLPVRGNSKVSLLQSALRPPGRGVDSRRAPCSWRALRYFARPPRPTEPRPCSRMRNVMRGREADSALLCPSSVHSSLTRTTAAPVSISRSGPPSPLPPVRRGVETRLAPPRRNNEPRRELRQGKSNERARSRRPGHGARPGCVAFFHRNPKRLSATDISALASMKNVAKCDTWCELQNPVNHRVFERKLRPKPLGRGHVCLGVTHRCPPAQSPLGGRGVGRAETGLPCAPRSRLAEIRVLRRPGRDDRW